MHGAVSGPAGRPRALALVRPNLTWQRRGPTCARPASAGLDASKGGRPPRIRYERRGERLGLEARQRGGRTAGVMLHLEPKPTKVARPKRRGGPAYMTPRPRRATCAGNAEALTSSRNSPFAPLSRRRLRRPRGPQTQGDRPGRGRRRHLEVVVRGRHAQVRHRHRAALAERESFCRDARDGAFLHAASDAGRESKGKRSSIRACHVFDSGSSTTFAHRGREASKE